MPDITAPPVRMICDVWSAETVPRIISIYANHWSLLVLYEEQGSEAKTIEPV